MERVRRIVGSPRRHQGREDWQGEIGDQGLGDRRRMANSVPENITIRIRADGARRKGITADAGLCDIGDPKLWRVGGDLLEMGRDIEPSNLDRQGGFELL